MASIEVEHVFNCVGNTADTGIYNNIFSGKAKPLIKKNFFQCPNIFQRIVRFELFVEQMGVKTALVRFTTSTSLSRVQVLCVCLLLDFSLDVAYRQSSCSSQ